MASNTVFLDTSGWIALLNTRDALYVQARSLWRDLGRQRYIAIVTDWVIAETGNGLARTSSREDVRDAVRRMLTSPRSIVEFVDEELLDAAVEFYHQHNDKDWGLVDCASFVVMRRRGIQLALTNDHHFEQAGFTCLSTIRPEPPHDLPETKERHGGHSLQRSYSTISSSSTSNTSTALGGIGPPGVPRSL